MAASRRHYFNQYIAARVRRVTLSNLPADADLTLIQSLVHGGAVDDMKKLAEGKVENITDAYRNGVG